VKCLRCGKMGGVADSRRLDNGARRRRYRCASGHLFTTYEVYAVRPETMREIEGTPVLKTKRLEKGLALQQAWSRMAALEPEDVEAED
jgi:transcriptional regulator NrdR family protein